MKSFIQLTITASLGLLVGCSSFPAQGVWETEAPLPGFRLEIAAETNGRAPARILIASFPGAVLEGAAEREPGGGWTVSLTTLKWFNTWPNGWTDASFLLEGVVRFEKSNDRWTVRTDSPPSIAVADKASLRYFDTYLLADKALEQFSRRWDRVQAAAEFLNSQFPDSWMNDPDRVARFLFPELHGYENNEHAGQTKVTDGMAWDVTYSASHFPENLRPVRDSGTMLRDYQESPGLWSLAFHWKNFWEHVGAVVLEQKKSS